MQVAGTDPVYVSRLRRDLAQPQTGLCMWVVADNLRIGAALNAVRIAEILVKKDNGNFLRPKKFQTK
jgi:aspartate-semialdehyde dehydrogenase